MSDKSPAFQFYPNDFLGSGKVGVMTVDEVGAYMLLLCLDWNEDGFALDEKRLARWCRVSAKKFSALWQSTVRECFTEGPDHRWRNDRLQRERAKQLAWKEKCARGGKRSAEVKAKGSSTTLDGYLEVNANTLSLSPSPLPSPTPVTTEEPKGVADAPLVGLPVDPPPPPPPAKPKGEPAPWMGAVRETWRAAYGGEPPKGATTALRPLVEKFTADVVVAHLARYCAETGAGFTSLPKFAQTFGSWAPSAPIQETADGWFTPEFCRSIGMAAA